MGKSSQLGLFAAVIFLLLLMSNKVSSRTSYAMNAKSAQILAAKKPVTGSPIPVVTIAPPPPTAAPPTTVPPTTVPPTTVPPTTVPPTTVPPTAVPPTKVPPTAVPPTKVPTSAATQPVPLQPPASTPTNLMPPDSPPVAIPTLLSTTTPSVYATATITPKAAKVAVTPSVLTATPHLQSTDDQGINTLTLSLALGVGAPLLLISVGALWIVVKWQINRRRRAQEEAAQANPWMTPQGMQQPSLHALQSASGAALTTLAPSPSAPGVYQMSAPLTQSTYTPSDLRPVTITFPQQLLPLHAHGLTDYPRNSDLRPLSIDSSVDFALEMTHAIESNGNGSMPLLPASPTALMDTPTSSMPSSPPISSQMVQQTSIIKKDVQLEEARKEAQMGLFVLPGRQDDVVL